MPVLSIPKLSGKRRFSFTSSKSKWKDTYKPPPNTTGRKTLVLDLDETLIHSSSIPPHDLVEAFKSGDPPFYVYKRPGVDSFLEFVRDKFEVFIFTHGEKEYAGPVIDVLIPWLDEDHRLYRDACNSKDGTPQKDISLFARDKKSLVLVDDSPCALKMNQKNTILIQKWMGVPYDKALIEWLPPILEQCLAADDVRTVVNEVKKKHEIESKKLAMKGILISA